jgi:Carboxypeptidase regulatory-like domain
MFHGAWLDGDAIQRSVFIGTYKIVAGVPPFSSRLPAEFLCKLHLRSISPRPQLRQGAPEAVRTRGILGTERAISRCASNDLGSGRASEGEVGVTIQRRDLIYSLALTTGCLLLLSLTPVHASAQGRGGRSQVHDLRGLVVDMVTGQPVARAEVFVLGQPRPVLTDASGQFRHRLATVSYLLSIKKEGYVTMTWEVAAVPDTSNVFVFELRPQRDGLASGQAGSSFIMGRLVDSDTEEPIPGGTVLIVGRPELVFTDSVGRFRHAGLAPTAHVVNVTKIGYEPTAVELMAVEDSTVVYTVDMPRSKAILLDSVVVPAEAEEPRSYWHRDFEDRRRGGRGQFITRAEIEQRRASSVGDLLRTLNGLRMVCTRQGCEVRMTRTNCRPGFFADGYPADATTVERMPVNDVFGVEVYNLFEAPVQLQRPELQCGVIAVWTRRGPPPR